MMTVHDVYEKCNKDAEHWSISIYDLSGNVRFGFCNRVYRYDNIPNDIRALEVDSFTLGYDSISLKVNQPYEEFLSEEEAVRKGYERVYPKENSSKILFRKVVNGVSNYAVVDFLKYMFLKNQNTI